MLQFPVSYHREKEQDDPAGYSNPGGYQTGDNEIPEDMIACGGSKNPDNQHKPAHYAEQ